MNTRMIQSGGASLRRAIPLVVFAVMFAAILGGSSPAALAARRRG